MPRILKYGTNVGYNLLYCVKENQPPHAYHSLCLSIFLSFQANLASMRESSNFVYTLRVA